MGTPHPGAAQGWGEPLVPQSCSESNPHTCPVLSPGKGAKRGARGSVQRGWNPRGLHTLFPLQRLVAGTENPAAGPRASVWGVVWDTFAFSLSYQASLQPSREEKGREGGKAGWAALLSRERPAKAKNSKALARFRDPPAPSLRTPPAHTRTHTRESLTVSTGNKAIFRMYTLPCLPVPYLTCWLLKNN